MILLVQISARSQRDYIAGAALRHKQSYKKNFSTFTQGQARMTGGSRSAFTVVWRKDSHKDSCTGVSNLPIMY